MSRQSKQIRAVTKNPLDQSVKVWDWEQFMTTLSVSDQKRFGDLDLAIRGVWQLGQNVVLAWTFCESGIEILHLPYYRVPDLYHNLAEGAGPEGGDSEILNVFSGKTFVSRDDFRRIERIAACERERLAITATSGERDAAVIGLLVRRYGIMWSRNRAVVLLDIDHFSVLTQLEQVTQLNSLNLSLNRAQMHLGGKPLGSRFARSTTGDGFYIWNEARSAEGNVALYHLMHLALAHNAITRNQRRHTTPSLRTCFHIGELFEFFQTEGLAPSLTRYIVGEVTVQLARLSTAARAGQILVGDFLVTAEPDAKDRRFGPAEFLQRLQGSLSVLEGVRLGSEEIESIRCYLTGPRNANGTFNVNKYVVKDKHAQPHYAYNAKINIYRRNADPIWLGIEDKELEDLEIAETIETEQRPS
jgi:class 3 adenylate cyclase